MVGQHQRRQCGYKPSTSGSYSTCTRQTLLERNCSTLGLPEREDIMVLVVKALSQVKSRRRQMLLGTVTSQIRTRRLYNHGPGFNGPGFDGVRARVRDRFRVCVRVMVAKLHLVIRSPFWSVPLAESRETASVSYNIATRPTSSTRCSLYSTISRWTNAVEPSRACEQR